MICFRPCGIYFPGPKMGNDDHYLSFGSSPCEDLCPSPSNAKKAEALPFTLTGRHVQNVEVMFQSEECKLRRQLEKSYPIREPWPPLFWNKTVKPI